MKKLLVPTNLKCNFIIVGFDRAVKGVKADAVCALPPRDYIAAFPPLIFFIIVKIRVKQSVFGLHHSDCACGAIVKLQKEKGPRGKESLGRPFVITAA